MQKIVKFYYLWKQQYQAQQKYFLKLNPIINAPKSNPVLPYVAKTRNSTGLKILTLAGDQKVFSQPSQFCSFLYQGGEIHRFYDSEL